MKRWSFAVLALIVSCASGNLQRGAGQGDSMTIEFTGKSREEVCKEILTLLRRAYVDERVNDFMAWVSLDYARDYALLRDAINRDVRSFDTILLDFWIDRVTASGKDRLVDVRWEKRYDDRASGRRLTARGATLFIFRDDRDGYRLYDMRGDMLFGFSSPETQQTPDLEVVTVDASTATESLVISAQIRNRGTVAAQNVRVRVSVDEPNVAAGQDKFIAVLPGQIVTVTWDLGIASAGNATVTVDPLNEIIESDEFNNEKSDSYP